MTGPPADVLVLFGITGDLARKMILPALYRLSSRGQLTVPVVGVARTTMDTDGLRKHVDDSVRAALGEEVGDAAMHGLLERVFLVPGEFSDGATFDRLGQQLRQLVGDQRFAAYYLAVPPSLFGPVADALAAAGLAERGRLVVEKPFGHDLASARELNARLTRNFSEDRLFHVDHYLGKEPVEDLLVLRFGNTAVEALWNRSWVRQIEITMSEDFDVADRGSFYDAVGTVRDVVQNHLLQVLAYVTMDAPDSDSGEDQRHAKHRLLRAVRALDPAEVVRGQYDGYRQTPGVAPDSTTETFVALTLHIDNWRWAGVPVYIRAGKDLPVTTLDVVVVLQPPPKALFVGQRQGPPPPNRVLLRLQPDARLALVLLAKQPGDEDVAMEVPVSVDFRQVLGPTIAPYERILSDALAGDPTHFAPMDNVEESWRIVGPVLDKRTEPSPYRPGTWGPSAAETLPGPAGWQPLTLPAERPRAGAGSEAAT
jgi:glucose-6-phosphate 1-dehydrogenase